MLVMVSACFWKGSTRLTALRLVTASRSSHVCMQACLAAATRPRRQELRNDALEPVALEARRAANKEHCENQKRRKKARDRKTIAEEVGAAYREYQDAAQGEFEQRLSAGRWRLVIEDSNSDNVLEGRAPAVCEPQDLTLG